MKKYTFEILFILVALVILYLSQAQRLKDYDNWYMCVQYGDRPYCDNCGKLQPECNNKIDNYQFTP